MTRLMHGFAFLPHFSAAEGSEATAALMLAVKADDSAAEVVLLTAKGTSTVKASSLTVKGLSLTVKPAGSAVEASGKGNYALK